MRKLLAVGFIAVALLSACGSDNGNGNDENDPSASTAVTDEPSATNDSAIGAGGDCQDNSKADGPGDLEMQDFVFAPPCLKINTGQGLRIHNEGDVIHNFSVEGFAGLDVDVEAGAENNTEATGLKAGEYTMFCKFHREANDMEGKLVVVAP